MGLCDAVTDSAGALIPVICLDCCAPQWLMYNRPCTNCGGLYAIYAASVEDWA